MAFAIISKEDGTFIGSAMGLAFFSKLDTVGQTVAWVGDTHEDTLVLKNELSEYMDDLDIVEVRSGHWRDLQAAGLDIGDMMANELMNRPAASSDMPVAPASIPQNDLASMPIAGSA